MNTTIVQQNRMKEVLSMVLELSKIKITVAVAITTIAGYVLGRGGLDSGIVLPVIGLFLIACSASVINHIQEMKSDALMERTRARPLPSGRFPLQGAVLLSILQLLAGSWLLLEGAGITSLLLALLALVWYNLVYTSLKKITYHAVIPGSLIGAIPPLVGWVAAGGELITLQAMVIGLFFFTWQVPHFYLLSMKYEMEYIKAGFPSITQKYTTWQLKQLIFYWVVGTGVASFLLPITGVTNYMVTLIMLGILSFRLVILFLKPLWQPSMPFEPGRYFMRLNYYVLLVTLVLIVDALVGNRG